MRKSLKIAATALLLLYPFLVAAALFHGVSANALALGLIIVAGIVAFSPTLKIRGLWLIAAILAGALFFTKNEIFLKIYPVMMNGTLAAIFGISLLKKPIVEIFAERMHADLDERGRLYTSKATLAWTLFLCGNTLVSLATVFAPLEIWTLYNGFISYCLIGLMMLGEFLIRKKAMSCATR